MNGRAQAELHIHNVRAALWCGDPGRNTSRLGLEPAQQVPAEQFDDWVQADTGVVVNLRTHAEPIDEYAPGETRRI